MDLQCWRSPRRPPAEFKTVLFRRRDGESSDDFCIVKAEFNLVKPIIMKHPTVYSLSIVAAFLTVWINSAAARPIGFSELSLLVRMHEPEASIKNEVAERKLLHGLTQPQEGILKSQGASDSLIKSLRDSNLVASKDEVAAAESAAREASASADTRSVNRQRHVEILMWRLATRLI